jgi:hypothetical protein
MTDAHRPAHEPQLTRRGLLRATTGLGLIAATGLPAGLAHAAGQPLPTEPPLTRLDSLRAGRARLRTGPFQTVGVAPGERVALALLAPGAGPQAGGPAPLVTGVDEARLVAAGVGPFQPDEGVERGVRRLLGGLSVPRPIGIHAYSAATLPGEGLAGGLETVVEWEARLRPGVTAQALLALLSGFHAVVLGGLAPDGAFGDQLTFVRIRQVG